MLRNPNYPRSFVKYVPHPPWTGSLALLATCRQINHEAFHVPFDRCIFNVYLSADPTTAAYKTGKTATSLLRCIEIGETSGCLHFMKMFVHMPSLGPPPLMFKSLRCVRIQCDDLKSVKHKVDQAGNDVRSYFCNPNLEVEFYDNDGKRC